MSNVRKLKQAKKRRSLRVRSALSTAHRPRVSVYRSLNHIYAQVIDDNEGRTVVGFSTVQLKNAQGDKTTQAKSVGLELASRAKEKGVGVVVFDRGRFKYHGRVKALAEGLREGGLTL